MNLLLITKDENKHYVLIRDFNSFMYNQSKHKERKQFCMYCLQCFSSEIILSNHIKNCLTINGKQAINMPKEGENILKFNKFHKQLPVLFVIYADFEAITKKKSKKKQTKKPIEMRRRECTLKPTKLMKIVAANIRSYIAMMTNIASQSKRIEAKTLSTKSWKRCSKRLNTAKTLLSNISTNHWL